MDERYWQGRFRDDVGVAGRLDIVPHCLSAGQQDERYILQIAPKLLAPPLSSCLIVEQRRTPALGRLANAVTNQVAR